MTDETPLSGRKVLVTGPTGVLGAGVTRRLAADNDVWAIARFSDDALRSELEDLGVTCVRVDFDAPDLTSLPTDFEHVVHMAVTKRTSFDKDISANVEALGHLMAHCRDVDSFLHVSTTAVYEANGHHSFSEGDPLGDNHRAAVPTYSICKIAAEAMARFGAKHWNIPTTIARLNVPYSDHGGWPAMHLDAIVAGEPIAVHTDSPSQYSPIHEDDIVLQIPQLLAHASVPATIVNWAGDEVVSIEEWCEYLGSLVGIEPKFYPTDATLESVVTDTTKLRSLVGSPTVQWRDGMRRMVQHLQPAKLDA